MSVKKGLEYQTQNKYKRVLVARFSSMGDVAMAIPVVYSVCMANPDTEFMMLTQKVASTLFINMPENLHVKGIKKDDYKGVCGMHRLFKEIKKEFNPDSFVDLHGNFRSSVIAFFCILNGIKVRQIKHGTAGKRALTRRNSKRLFTLISFRARYREVFHRMGFSFYYLFESIFHGKTADSSVFSEIIDTDKGNEKWIAIAPLAKHKGKIYPLGKMEKVVEELSSRENYRIFLLGSNTSERETLHFWAEKYHNVISIADKHYGFHKELALLSHCDAMISMDSANMHLASLVNLPTVSVWGATHPYCGFLGWKQSEENAVQLNLTCRPCSILGDKPCISGDYFCLNGIKPEMIINSVDNILNKGDK